MCIGSPVFIIILSIKSNFDKILQSSLLLILRGSAVNLLDY